MGYDTNLIGCFNINRKLTTEEIEYAEELLSLDSNDYENYDCSMGKPRYIQIQITDDYQGIIKLPIFL